MAKCQLCGEPMPPGEEIFNFHGYSGPCPKPTLVPPPVPKGFDFEAFKVEANKLLVTAKKELSRGSLGNVELALVGLYHLVNPKQETDPDAAR